jgi:hypothetical protein
MGERFLLCIRYTEKVIRKQKLQRENSRGDMKGETMQQLRWGTHKFKKKMVTTIRLFGGGTKRAPQNHDNN